jgi:hypothetical protein
MSLGVDFPCLTFKGVFVFLLEYFIIIVHALIKCIHKLFLKKVSNIYI